VWLLFPAASSRPECRTREEVAASRPPYPSGHTRQCRRRPPTLDVTLPGPRSAEAQAPHGKSRGSRRVVAGGGASHHGDARLRATANRRDASSSVLSDSAALHSGRRVRRRVTTLWRISGCRPAVSTGPTHDLDL
jgi:hypothetical protein